ncbi:MAG: YggS family pyridoxal phosphate-dependent enzyme [Litoreibacter sp.]|nr:YggS family pyridoxal phosphate-dependent enzyme [Litoreibacter sp.]
MSLQDIQSKIVAEETRVGRSAGSTQLIAVSKVQPNERVEAVLVQGHRIFGENKVQEAASKWPGFKDRFDGVELHLLGPLQTNKTKQAMELFDVIHSLDRLKLAKKLATLSKEIGQCPDLFIQVNTGKEEQKAGIMPEDADSFIAECRDLGLPIIGLMCIPPAEEEPSLHFALLAKIAKRNGLGGLSMGMSGDFERAIAQGATHVRVGSAIFGARDYG